mmetsp:Transcript_20188/g.48123  ORF Transcript_20188/g.48123 Transcript_20188/m.48123 type:complete len:263 (+) Transcript_20188:23-811(+)
MPKDDKKKPQGQGARRAAAPYQAKEDPLFERKPKNFGIGNAIQPKRDLTRFVKYPKYIRLQRQRRILNERLKVPPSINQFTRALDKGTATDLFRLLTKYRPEDKAQKKARLQELAEAKAAKKDAAGKKPVMVKYGINHIATLVEQRKAQLVVIAHDVTPIEVVVWLPALCRKCEVPYCIVKGKARLGQVVHKKTATALALTAVRPEDQGALAKLVDAVKANYNDRFDEQRRQWGGGIMGIKSNHAQDKKAKARAREEAKRVF